MSFKKITLAAALSVGMMAIGGAAQAADGCAACPTKTPACPEENRVMSSEKVCAPVCTSCDAPQGDLDYVERQVYAFPNLGGDNYVIPNDNKLIQIGQSEDTSVPMQNNITGAAAPLETEGVVVNNRAGVGLAGEQFDLDEKCPCPADDAKAQAEERNARAAKCAAPQQMTGAAAGIGCPREQESPSCGPQPAESMSFQSQSGLQIEKTIPECKITGAAAGIIEPQFTDISSDFWASNQINKLAAQGILAGYPDRSYKPLVPVLRSEFASMIVAGLDMEDAPMYPENKFTDVPENHWAYKDIYRAYNQGYMKGYPDDSFRPSETITRAEAFTTIAKALPGELTGNEANCILSTYQDDDKVPDWAKTGYAETVQAGLTKDFPNPDKLEPGKDASRAEMAAVISQLRKTLALDPSDLPTGAATEIQTFPTLSLKFNDMLHAKSSHVGDKFVAETQEEVIINGVSYPRGSKVTGEIVEVIRPNLDNKGAVKLAFDKIEYGDSEAKLPRQILSAGIEQKDNVNIVSRAVAFPFTWTGKVIGTAGRSISTIGTVASNTGEDMLANTGYALGHVFSGEFGAAGRNTIQVGTALGEGVIDTGKTLVSGTIGVFKESGDELAYVVNPDTLEISSIDPDEVMQIAFGCPVVQ